jgi:hypothetical protein
MRTWIITARSPTGKELPIGLAHASSEAAAMFRARTKVAQMPGASGYEIIVRPG